MSRYEKNMAILGVLERYLKAHPDQRLGQALVNLHVVEQEVDWADDGRVTVRTADPFYEEPSATLARVMEAYYG